jgi:hypothetical protein
VPYKYGILKGGILAERVDCANCQQRELGVRDLLDISAGLGKQVE